MAFATTSAMAAAMSGIQHGMPPGLRAYAEHASCRLGRRGKSVRMAGRRASGGRMVDPDAPHRLLQHQYYQQLLQMQHQHYAQQMAANRQGMASQVAHQSPQDPAYWAKVKKLLGL